MATFLSYFVPYMLIIIILVSTSLNEQWSYLKNQLQLMLTDIRYVACTILIHIFKRIQKVPNLFYKPINQHRFSSVNASI